MGAIDRTGWTPLQIAWADEAATDGRLHAARSESQEAEWALADWGDSADDNVRHRVNRRASAAAEELQAAEVAYAAAHKALRAVQRLTRAQFADILGIKPATLSSYVARGQAPVPDGRDEHDHPWWLGTTVDEYAARTKRPGARTDLKPRLRIRTVGGWEIIHPSDLDLLTRIVHKTEIHEQIRTVFATSRTEGDDVAEIIDRAFPELMLPETPLWDTGVVVGRLEWLVRRGLPLDQAPSDVQPG